MKHIELFNIKLNHIRIFLSVVEYGSFTVAAEKLYLTQPYVSKTIEHLEEELNLYLFIRGNRKFQVTPAGRMLYQEWKGMLESFEHVLESAHAVQEGLSDKLLIGLGALSSEEGCVVQNLKKVHEHIPGVDIHIEYNNMSALVERLINDKIDLAVISKHMLPMIEKTKLQWQTLIESYLAVYVHRENPLFETETMEFKDLKNEKFIVFSTEKDDSYLKLLQRLSAEAGFTPQISCYIPNEMSFKVNLEMGNGVVLADSASNLAGEDIRQFNLEMRNDVVAVWKPEKYRESIGYFLSLFV